MKLRLIITTLFVGVLSLTPKQTSAQYYNPYLQMAQANFNQAMQAVQNVKSFVGNYCWDNQTNNIYFLLSYYCNSPTKIQIYTHRAGDDSNIGETWIRVSNGTSGSLIIGEDQIGDGKLDWEIRPGDRFVVYVNDKYYESGTFPKGREEFDSFVASVRSKSVSNGSGITYPPGVSSLGGSGSQSSSQQKCGYCNGTGRVDDTVATYGNTSQKWCNECGRMREPSHCHGCKICPSCNGKGYK